MGERKRETERNTEQREGNTHTHTAQAPTAEEHGDFLESAGTRNRGKQAENGTRDKNQKQRLSRKNTKWICAWQNEKDIQDPTLFSSPTGLQWAEPQT